MDPLSILHNITRKTNFPLLIYIVINVLIIGSIIGMLFSLPFGKAMIIGTAIYAVSVAIALSPIGEFILRLQTGCSKMDRADYIDIIEPSFREVYEKARLVNLSLSKNIELFVTESDDINAFATGRTSICITDSFLELEPELISACLAHEFGHISHRDTDLILIVSVGNLMINAIILVAKGFMKFVCIMFSMLGLVGGPVGIMTAAIVNTFSLLMNYLINGITWIWSKLGMLLVLQSNRDSEYDADKFAFNLGYGEGLCLLLDTIDPPKEKGLFANLANSHPDSNSRIANLQNLGVPYKKFSN